MHWLMLATLVIAHRGASGVAPENTLAAFREAVRLGAEWIELDVQFSREGVPVVLHDETLNRTSSGRGAVSRKSVEELRGLDAGSWFDERFRGEPIPTLEQVLQWIRPTPANLLIEIKKGKGFPPEFARTVAAMLEREGMQSRVLVQSFDPVAVQRVKEADSSLSTLLLMNYRSPDPAREALQVGAEGAAIRHDLVSAETVRNLRDHNLKLFVWTVNEVEDIRRMLALGVDGIISDFPDRVRKLRDQMLSGGLGPRMR